MKLSSSNKEFHFEISFSFIVYHPRPLSNFIRLRHEA